MLGKPYTLIPPNPLNLTPTSKTHRKSPSILYTKMHSKSHYVVRFFFFEGFYFITGRYGYEGTKCLFLHGKTNIALLVIRSLKCSSPHPDQGSLKLLTKIIHVIGRCLGMKNFFPPLKTTGQTDHQKFKISLTNVPDIG